MGMKPSGPGQTERQERQGKRMAVYTDIAPEIYPPGRGRVPEGVRCTVHQAGACRITRVRIERDGLARPAGHYVTVEMPRAAALDDQDEKLTALLESGPASFDVVERHIEAYIKSAA